MSRSRRREGGDWFQSFCTRISSSQVVWGVSGPKNIFMDLFAWEESWYENVFPLIAIFFFFSFCFWGHHGPRTNSGNSFQILVRIVGHPV